MAYLSCRCFYPRMWHPGKLLLLLLAAAQGKLVPFVLECASLAYLDLSRFCCSAVPTYDEHSQKSGRCLIYFDTPQGHHVGVAEVEGKSLHSAQRVLEAAEVVGASLVEPAKNAVAVPGTHCCPALCDHAGFVLPDPIQAKFNRKQGKYTFK